MGADRVLLLCAFCFLAFLVTAAVALIMRETTQGSFVSQASHVPGISGGKGRDG